jgi:flagellar hook-associated protein 2
MEQDFENFLHSGNVQMATISSAGIGSGLDVNSIVTQLIAVENKPLTQMQKTASNYQAQLSAFGQLKSQMSTLNDASSGLATAASWKVYSASSTNPAAVSATTSTGVIPGGVSVQVQNLASAQASASVSIADTLAVGTGTLTIELGSWSAGQSSFSSGGGAAISISIGTGEDSLNAIASKINAANAGITASVLQDASGSRLLFRSTTTGEINALRVQVSDSDGSSSDGAGLSRLAFDPPSGAAGMTLTQTAANARATINGVPVSSSTNQLNSVLPGLTLQLSQVTTSPVDVNVATDTAALRTKISAFVDAYNALNKSLADDVKYDAGSKTGGILQGDRTAVSLQTSLRGLIRSSIGSATFARLSDAGIEIQQDGSLKLNDKKFAAALQASADLGTLFNADGSSGTLTGIAVRMKAMATGLLDFNGALTTKAESLQKAITKNADDQSKFSDRVAKIEARLRAQYSSLDTKMAQLNTLSSYVSQQVTQWNKSSNG